MPRFCREDALLEGARGPVDDGERRPELVYRILDEASPLLVGALQRRRHFVEGTPHLAELVGSSRETGSAAEIPAGDPVRSFGELRERPRHPAGEEEPDPGGNRRGDERHEKQGDRGVLLDLSRVLHGHRAGAVAVSLTSPAAVGGDDRGVRLELAEAAPDDGRNRDRDDGRRGDRDGGKPDPDLDAEVHRGSSSRGAR